MKRSSLFKALLSLVLAILFVLSPTFETLTVFKASSAFAQEVSALPPASSDDGDWLYRITADGFAQVLGHRDASAAALTIPRALGGAWVTQISDHAFASHAQLRDIIIPAAVHTVAPTAFPGGTGLTIHAPNGSAALRFAAEHGFAAHNTSPFDFFDTILDLSEMRSAQFSVAGSSVILQEPYASLVQAGSLVFFPATAEYSKGLPVRVLSIQRMGSSSLAAFEPLTFEETLASFAVEAVPLTPDVDNIIILTEGFEVQKPADDPSATPRLSLNTSFSPSVSYSVNRQINKDCKISGTIAYSPKYSVSVKYEWFKLRELSYTNSSSTTLDIKIESSIDLYENKDTINITFARVPLTTPTLISVWLDISLVVSLEGEVSLHTEITTSDSFSWKEGKNPVVSKDKSVKVFTIDAGIAIKPELKFAFVVSLGFASKDASIDIAELFVSVGAVVEATASTSSPGCANVKVQGVFKVGIRVGLLSGRKASVFGSWTPINITWNIVSGHFESGAMAFVDQCQYENKHRVSFFTGTQEQYPDYAAKPGDLLPTPVPPTRSGYTFIGWFRDAGCRNPWHFEYDTVNAPMVLYAGWVLGSGEPTPTATPTVTPEPTGDPSVTPVPTLAPDELSSLPFLVWEQGYQNIAITGFTGEPLHLVIPAYIDGLPVKYIGYNAFQDCTTLLSVTLPDTLEGLYNDAFHGCSSLGRVTFKGDIRIVGSSVFKDCTRLQEVTFGRKITESMGHSMFAGCISLQEIRLPQAPRGVYGGNTFAGCVNLRSVHLQEDITAIPSEMFSGCTSLQRIFIPAGVTTIDSYAFRNCTALLNVNLPESLVSIGEEAFAGCTSLFEFTMHDAVTTIGNNAFDGCSKLINAELSRGLQTIGKYAFRHCTSLEDVKLHSAVTSVGRSAYQGCTSLSTLLINGSLSLIDQYAFDGCTSLRDVTFGGSVQTIGQGAFSGCSFLEEITLPLGLTTLGKHAFEGCYSLRAAALPSTLQTIDDYAFADCISLVDISLPRSVSTIGYSAFNNCQSLQRVALPASLTVLNNQTFYGCSSLQEVSFPAGLTSIGYGAFYQCFNLKQITLPGSLTKIDSSAFYHCYGLKQVTFNGSFSNLTIGSSAFENCTALESLRLPYGTTSIGDAAFRQCYCLRELYMPDTLTAVGKSSFSSCTSLTQIRFSPQLSSIGQWAFATCSALTTLNLPPAITSMGMLPFSGANAVTTLVIPDTYTSIPAYAFAQMAGLTELYIPSSVREINTWAFTNCSSLEYIHITSATTSIASDAFNTIPNLRGVYVDTLDCYAADYFAQRYDAYYTPIMLEPWASAQVTLLANGGAPDRTIVAERDARLPDVPTPTRPNYVFRAWYKDPACTQLWRYRDRVSGSNLTLYAGWDYAPDHIAYTIQGGQAAITGYTGDDAMLTIPATMAGAAVTAIATEAIPPTLTALHIPAGVTEISPDAFLWAASLSSITVDAGNPIYHAVDGVLYTRDGQVVCYPAARSAEAYTPLDGTTAIGQRAFHNCRELTALTLPASISTLAPYAIDGCAALTEVTFAADPVSIGAGTLLGCHRRMAITGPLGAPILEAWADAYGLHYNEYCLTFMNGSELLGALFVRAGDPLPSSFQPESNVQTLAFWAEEGSATGWDFSTRMMPAADVTLVAVWKDDFQYASGSEGLTLTAYSGSKTTVTVPEEHGGLPVIAIASGAFGSSVTTLRGNKGSPAEAYAAAHGLTFDPLVYTVTFVCNGGTPVPAQNLCATEAIPQPEVLRSGCTLIGWYTDEAHTTRWDFAAQAMPPHDLTLYAAWGKTDASAVQVPFTFEAFDQGLAITGYTGSTAEASIPAEINGLPVLHIAERAFAGNTTLLSLTLPDCLTSIGRSAFAASRIGRLQAGSGLKSIGDSAFADCAELSDLTLPDTVTVIGPQAFQNCTALTGVELPESLTLLSRSLFAGCSYLSDVTLPAGLETIDAHAFDGCTLLPVINLGAQVTSVDSTAFHGCTALAAINVAAGSMYYRSIDGVLFSADGTMLLLFPQGLRGSYLLPAGTLAIGQQAMQGCRLTSLTLNQKLMNIGNHALRDSLWLTTLTWPENALLAGIGTSAFDGCSSLRTLDLPVSLREIGAGAFAHCQLASVSIPANADVGSMAFPAAPGLTIYGARGSDAQRYAQEHGIRFVDLAVDVPVTGVSLPAACTMTVGETVTLTAALQPAGTTETTLVWTSLHPAVATVDSTGAVRAMHAGTALIQAVAANGSIAQCSITVSNAPAAPLDLYFTHESLTLAAGESASVMVHCWPAGSVAGNLSWSTANPQVATCTGGLVTALNPGETVLTVTAGQLTATCTITVTAAAPAPDLVLPAGLLRIEDEAFLGNPAGSVVCPAGLASIGSRAFAACPNLRSIVIPGSITVIADDAFQGCTNLTIIAPAGSEAHTHALTYGFLWQAD